MSKNKFQKIILIIMICFFCGPYAYPVSWIYNLNSGLSKAKKEGKPVMIDFYTNWCGWCKKLDKDTYEDKTVLDLSKKFICVKLDGDKNQQFVSQYNVSGYPAIIFLDSNGKVVDRVPGYQGPGDFARTMNGVLRRTKRPEPEQKIQPTILPQPLAKSDRFKLTGIIYDSKNPKAIVNDMIVKVGDMIEDAKVSDIGQDKVVLSVKEREITLTIE